MNQSVYGKKIILNLVGLGDVGSQCLVGLRLLGGEVISEIGIYDPDAMRLKRYEAELNQVFALQQGDFPTIRIINESELFKCDVFAFCASRSVPPIGSEQDGKDDVRKRQFSGNAAILKPYVEGASESHFNGLFAIISDPVDQLCQFALEAGHLKAHQIKGFGLGVMYARARYLAKELDLDPDDVEVYGPHGSGLIVANSVEKGRYHASASNALTHATETFNLRVREWGFKPFIAPALSSAALSLIGLLEGKWHYSTIWIEEDSLYFGTKNRWDGTRWINDNERECQMDPLLLARIEETKGLLKIAWSEMKRTI